MALKTQRVVGDVGSQELAQLLHSYNHLLDALDTLISGLSTAADITAVNTLATTALASVEANAYKVVATKDIPLSPALPLV